MMSKAQSSQGKECPPFPRNFNRELYGFSDDFSLWISALAKRVALRKKFEEILVWSALEIEFPGSRSEILGTRLADLRSKVMGLIHEPIQLEQDGPYQGIAGGDRFTDRTHHLDISPPIRGRLIRDEIESAAKLKSRFFRKIVGFNIDTQLESGSGRQEILDTRLLPCSAQEKTYINSSLLNEQKKLLNDEALSKLTENDDLWQADIKTPNFFGDFFLKVNLFYDDKKLRKAFSDWLKDTRAQAGLPVAKQQSVTLRKLQEWHKMRVLPYMDLWLYQLAFDVNFDETNLARLLFRIEDDTEGNSDSDYKNWLRNTRKCAESLIQQSVFLSLRYKSTPSRSNR
jgi:hypothetical protein